MSMSDRARGHHRDPVHAGAVDRLEIDAWCGSWLPCRRTRRPRRHRDVPGRDELETVELDAAPPPSGPDASAPRRSRERSGEIGQRRGLDERAARHGRRRRRCLLEQAARRAASTVSPARPLDLSRGLDRTCRRAGRERCHARRSMRPSIRRPAHGRAHRVVHRLASPIASPATRRSFVSACEGPISPERLHKRR